MGSSAFRLIKRKCLKPACCGLLITLFLASGLMIMGLTNEGTIVPSIKGDVLQQEFDRDAANEAEIQGIGQRHVSYNSESKSSKNQTEYRMKMRNWLAIQTNISHNEVLSKSSTTLKTGVVNPHPFSYILNVPDLCDPRGNLNKSADFVLFLIHSKASNAQQRRIIRNTWASTKVINQIRLIYLFLLADPKNEQLQESINVEFTNFSDIAQEDFYEHYRNLTHKHLMGYRWVTQFCSEALAVVKVDDDVFVNVYHLVGYLKHLIFTKVPQDSIYCSVYRKMAPRRDKSDKWYVSEKEYSKDVYPPYCEGFAYIIRPRLVIKLLEQSLYEKYYWIDDVYVTGILMERLHLSHAQFKDPYGYSVMSIQKERTTQVNSVLFVLAKYTKSTMVLQTAWTQMFQGLTRRYRATTMT